MNTFSTDGLDVQDRRLTVEDFQRHFRFQYSSRTSTEPIEALSATFEQEIPFRPIRSMMAAVVTAIGTLVGGESSSQIHPVWMSIVDRLREEDEERIATFIEPVRFSWDKRNNRIRVAARKYSENTNADY